MSQLSLRSHPKRILAIARTVFWIVLAAASLTQAALAATPLGSAVSVQPGASATRDGSSVQLKTGADLFEGDTIVTGDTGQVEIVFADNTHMVVGPNSSLLLETYLMQNAQTTSNFAVQALGGTFRFITGNSAKPAYHIATPTGTIGIRGTEFDFSVDKLTGETAAVLFKGMFSMCPTIGDCVVVGQRCAIGTINTTRVAQLLSHEQDRIKVAKSKFPYLLSQLQLRHDFQVETPGDCRKHPKVELTLKQAAPLPPPPPPKHWHWPPPHRHWYPPHHYHH